MGSQVTIRRNFGELRDQPLSSTALMREVGLLARARLYRRTVAGLDQADVPFQPYAPSYAAQRAKAGLSPRVTLQVSGDMLNALTLTEVTETSVTIGFLR